MEYISTRNNKKKYSFKEVFLKGLAPDGGLFVPKKIPVCFAELSKLSNPSYNKLAEEIIYKFCSDEFNKNEIRSLVDNSYKNFHIKNVIRMTKIGKLNLLELFHGPTLAFKDIAMQVIGNMYEKFLNKSNMKINIVVATSGDTGAAAINAIKNRKNIKIFVLHPENRISEIQRKFMTTIDSKNVFNIALDSNFDECQNFVKSMFADKNFRNSINMSGMNSINWARIIFQIVYYFYSYFQIAKKREKISFSVPTGNFGDIYAGYVAKKMGLPINKLILATNKNDILTRVVKTGIYKPQKVHSTITPSMDIQIASNFERLIFDIHSFKSTEVLRLMKNLQTKGELRLKDKELKRIKKDFTAESLNDGETKSILREVYLKNKILLDPHTAVGVGVLKKISIKGNVVVLSTAHPSKFPKVVSEATGIEPELPERFNNLLFSKENYDKLPRDLEKIKQYILARI